MNKLPVYLYPNVFSVLLDLDDNRSINNIMYQRKLQLQKGFKDSIQVQFKNSDQKPVAITTATNYTMDIIDNQGRQLVLSKPLTVLDDTVILSVNANQTATGVTLTFDDTSMVSVGQTASGFGIQVNTIVTAVSSGTVTLNTPTFYPVTSATNVTFNTLALRGLAEVTFLPLDTLSVTAASYKFIVKQDNGDGTFSPAYANTYYGIAGDLEIVEDGYPIGFPVQKVSKDQLIAGKAISYQINTPPYLFASPWLFPYPSAMTIATPQSAVLALDNFVGTITVQGTLDNSVSNAGHANVQSVDLTTYTTTTPTLGNIQLTWTGTYTAIRFVIVPAADGFGNNYYPTGNPIGSLTNQFPSGFLDNIQYIS